MTTKSIIITVIILISFALSCSGGSESPITPTVPAQTSVTAQADPVLNETPGHYLWGYYLFYVDPSINHIEVIPLRQVAGHWNVLKFLEQGPCNNCVSVKHMTPNPSGTKSFDVQIRHPFKTPVLTGFDVRGIAMFHGSHSFPASGLTTPDKATGDGELVNADGYTTLYNSETAGSGPGELQGYLKGKFASINPPSATLNGYKRHISGGTGQARNFFFADDSIIVTYELDMPDTEFIFGYAVDANWAPPSVKPVTDPITQFPPEANCSEPWKIEVTEEQPDNVMTDAGGITKIIIDVFDWQGKDSHTEPVLECPELFDGAVTAPWTQDGADWARYEKIIANDKLAPVGNYKLLVKVVDNDDQGSPDWLDLTAYQIHTVTVIQNVPPIALAGFDSTEAYAGHPVSFSDAGSYDPDGGGIDLFEWDWNNDGVYDDQAANQIHTWDTPGTYPVQFRVTDEEGSMDTLDSPLQVEVKDAGWAQTWEGGQGLGVAQDPDGNSYVAGYFSNTVDFDPGPGIDEHISNGSVDAFLCKYDPLGNFLWARTWGSTISDSCVAVTADYSGNAYVTGGFMGTVNFNPGGTDERTSNGGSDIFVSSFDTFGNYRWVDTWGGSAEDTVQDITCNGLDLIYVTGNFCFTVDFDPTGDVDEHTSSGNGDVFLTKLYETGYYYWTNTFGGLENDSGYGVSCDGYSNAYVAGSLGSIAFLYKYKSDGSEMWSKTWGGSPITFARDVAVDGFGTAYVTGSFQGYNINFDPGPGSDLHSSNGWADCYLSSYDPNGTYLWTKTWGGPENELAMSVSFNLFGIVYVAGSFEDTVDFDPGTGIDEHTVAGNYDCFLSRFNESGDFQWARTWGAGGYDRAMNVTAGIMTNKNAYVTGYFDGTVDFDPGDGVDEHTSGLFSGIFLTKFLQNGYWQ